MWGNIDNWLRFQNVQGGYGNTDKVDLLGPEYFSGINHLSCNILTARRSDRSAATCAHKRAIERYSVEGGVLAV